MAKVKWRTLRVEYRQMKHRPEKLAAFVSIFLFAAGAFAQRYSPTEDYGPEGSDYWYKHEFPTAFLAVLIMFVAPYFIAKRQGGDDGLAFLYHKWFFIFFAGFGVVLLLEFRSTMAFLIVNIVIAIYGLFFSKKKKD